MRKWDSSAILNIFISNTADGTLYTFILDFALSKYLWIHHLVRIFSCLIYTKLFRDPKNHKLMMKRFYINRRTSTLNRLHRALYIS